jgi:two-component system, OmpR family, response regulator
MLSGARIEMTNSQPGRTDIPDEEELAERAKLRVVIVEDSPIIRARLFEALSEIPNVAVVGEVETEADALAILRQAKWDAAVLDLQLKQGTGLGVLKSLAQGARPANTKVIVFTNYAFPQYRNRSMSLGADYFFDKSREFHRVREVLHTLAAGGSSESH